MMFHGHKDLWLEPPPPPALSPCQERAKGAGNPVHRTCVFTVWVPAQALRFHIVVPLGSVLGDKLSWGDTTHSP